MAESLPGTQGTCSGFRTPAEIWDTCPDSGHLPRTWNNCLTSGHLPGRGGTARHQEGGMGQVEPFLRTLSCPLMLFAP